MRIEKPILWFSQLINGHPKPWQYFKIDGIMVNSYEILQKRKTEADIRKTGIHNYLKFEGPVTMDSGGFLFMQKKRMDIKPLAILDLYKDSKPNFGVILDHPLGSNLTNVEKRKRLLATLRNTRQMVEAWKDERSNPQLIPVIHGHTTESIRWYIEELKKIGNFSIYGIGSLVPSVFNARGVGGIHNVIEIVSYARKLLRDRLTHVFGVGSSLTMHLMFHVGADSVDSSSWRMKAAFGAIQLPGVGDRYITGTKKHKTYRNLSREEERILDKCGCPACKEYSLTDLRKSFNLRAIHNAWVYQKEVEKVRRMEVSEHSTYVHRILRSTPLFYGALQLADLLTRKRE